MDYEQICYSWLHGGDYKGAVPDGWGIAATSNTDSAFLKNAVDLMTNRRTSLLGEVTEYFEYSQAFRCFIYLGVRKIPSLPQMGGGDNNRLMHLYIPTQVIPSAQTMPVAENMQAKSFFPVFPDINPDDYWAAVPSPGQRGVIHKAEFPEKIYDYQELLKKYGFHKEQGEVAANRLAVLLSLLYLSFYSDEWKQLIFPLETRNSYETGDSSEIENLSEVKNPYETAREITWLLHRLVPQEIFGKTRENLIHGLGYAVTEQAEGYQLTFLKRKSEHTALKEHIYDLGRNYDASVDISKEMLDRKVAGTANLFLALSKEAQESPEAANRMIQEILTTAKGTVDDIQELNKAYESDYIPYKLYDGMSKELYACSTLEGLVELSTNCSIELLEGIKRYYSCNSGTSTAMYLMGGTETLRLLADADVDGAVCNKILEKFEEADRFSGLLEELPVEERAAIHLIFEKVKELFWKKESELFSEIGETLSEEISSEKTETLWEEGCPASSKESETLREKGSSERENNKEDVISSVVKDHSDTAARMDALSGNRKKGSFLLNFLKKKD